MINKSKKLAWTIAIFLLAITACQEIQEPSAVSQAEIANSCELGIAIVDSGAVTVSPGTVLEFRANLASPDLKYIWSTIPQEFDQYFSDQEDNKIYFKVPAVSESFKIKLKVEMMGSCEETAESRAIEVLLPSTPVPTATPAPTLTPTEVPTEEPTEEPTLEPSPMPEPTEEPTLEPSPTPEPTKESSPTAVLQPQYKAPVITQLQFLPGGAVYLAWTWDGELSDTQNFAVRFWSEADPRPEARFSITWTKDFSYQFGVNNIDFPEGSYLINVAVMEGPSEGYHYALAESTNERVFVETIPPTPLPPVGP